MTLFQLERTADFDSLTTYLKRSSNPTIRARAAEILGSLEPKADGKRYSREAVIDALVRAAKDDDDEAVRAAAIDALDQYGQPALERFIGELSGHQLDDVAEWKKAEVLAKGLRASEPELRMAAATGLGRLGENNVVQPLLGRLDDPDPRVRMRVSRALARIGATESVPALSQNLHEEEYDVRVEVAYALADIGTNQALAELAGVTDDDDEVLRRIAVDALGRLGSVEAVELLAGALSDESEAVRRTAMFSLVELLSQAPSSASHRVRERIVDELEATSGRETVEPLIEILQRSTETAQRRNAAWLLGRIVDGEFADEAQEALIETLGDSDEMTSKFAATSLAQLDGRGLEKQLLDLVGSDREEEMRVKALFVLGKIGGDESRRVLSSFVERTESERLRKRGFSALSKLGGVELAGGDLT